MDQGKGEPISPERIRAIRRAHLIGALAGRLAGGRLNVSPR
jgi:hypothetical protein